VNSEELEQSLRMEFETYLNSVLAEMRQESEEFQNKIEAEFDRQRAQFTEAFRAFATRFDAAPRFDEAFTGSVSEHLRLARDEGAKIAATAMAEAEKLDDKPVAAAKYDAIRNAVNDISSKDSQSAILKSLIQHAEEFAPRGAFFIIKNEHFAGWKVFGSDDAESSIREVHFPSSNDTILGKAVSSLETVEASIGDHSGDSAFLDPLGFEDPGKMMALPLIARGRGVAVLFVDQAGGKGDINREALETLVRVAGLTVELLASTQTAHEENRSVAAADFENARHEHDTPQPAPYDDGSFRPAPEPAPASGGFSFNESSPYDAPQPVVTQESGFVEPAPEYGAPANQPQFDNEQPDFGGRRQTASPFTPEPEYESPSVSDAYPEPAEPQAPADPYAFGTPESTQPVQSAPFDSGYNEPADLGHVTTGYKAAEERDSDFSFETQQAEPATVGASPFDRAAEDYSPATASFDRGLEPVVPVPDTPPAPVGRLSDRNVDLPIEVPEEERRLHNDARRFARLLVSEIKLYNEKKVAEGRQSYDLYERLREAIDRSREMYDKRVQPPVAAKFDYFHYELTNSLAEGNVERLGPGYPGASV
jgi:hypothetical protein